MPRSSHLGIIFFGDQIYFAPMPDWTENVPWQKLGITAGTALTVALGGLFTKGKVDETISTARAPQAVQTEEMLRHYDWQTSCPVIGEDQLRGAQLRACPSDDCFMFVVVRGGLRQVFFSVAPREIPTAPMLLGWLDVPGRPIEAAFPHTCLADHGPPNGDPPLLDGADLGNGWVEQFLRWSDGCQMKRQFHRPTQSATAWGWSVCADQHY